MSDVIVTPETTKKASKPKVKSTKPRNKTTDLSDIQSFLSQLETEFKPSLHVNTVNGTSFLNCVLTVDFGQPLNPPKLSEEDEEKLKEKMRAATKLVLNRDVGIRVLNDPYYGIWWTSVA